VTIDCATRRAGIPNRIANFILPLGATVNMDGTALYEAVAALFIAQAYGMDLSLGQQATVLVMATLAAVGTAGIPSASLVMIAVVLGAVGLPLEGVGLILALDRLLDMCRSTVNVWGDIIGAAIYNSFESKNPKLTE
jgi:Na+/H+-dicarboxylate symporter